MENGASDYRARLREDYKNTADNRISIANSLDKWVIGAAAGLIGLSAGFLQITNFQVEAIKLLYTSWVFLALAMLTILVITYICLNYEDKTVTHIVEELNGQMTEEAYQHRVVNTPKMKRIEKLEYPIAFILLFAGIICLAVFSAFNLKSRNQQIKSENDLKQQQDELQVEKLKLEVQQLKAVNDQRKG